MNTPMDITSANSNALLIVEDLFPLGFPVMQYATDQGISQEERQLAEVRMGVDGKLVGGYTPTPYPLTLTLEANSPTIFFADQVISAMQARKKIFPLTLIITIPALRVIYTYERGIITNAKDFADIKKVLDPVSLKISFEKRLKLDL